MQHPVQPRADQEDQVSVLQREGARGGGGLLVVIREHALRHRHREVGQAGALHEGTRLLLRAGVGDAFADDHQRLLGRLDRGERRFNVYRVRLRASSIRNARRPLYGVLVHLPGDDVAGKVEVDRTGDAMQRLLHGFRDVERDSLDRLHTFGILRVGAQRRELIGLLEESHAVACALVRAAEQQHRPAVGPRVRERADGVQHARPRDGERCADAAAEVGDGLRGIRRRHLVPHTDVLDALALRGGCDPGDRDAHHAEQALHALRLQRARDDRLPIDFSHCSPLVSR